MRVDRAIEHQVLYPSDDATKPELVEASPSHPRLLAERPGHTRSLPPALSALDLLHRQVGVRSSGVLVPRSLESRRLLHTHLDLLLQLRSLRHFAGIQVLPKGNQQFSSQGH